MKYKKTVIALSLIITFGLFQNFGNPNLNLDRNGVDKYGNYHIYVSPTGNNHNSGTSVYEPKKTLQSAIYKAKNLAQEFKEGRKKSGTITIHLDQGRYYGYGHDNENKKQSNLIDFTIPGKALKIIGEGKHKTIFDGFKYKGPKTFMRISRGNMLANQAYNLTLKGFRVQNYHAGITISGSKNNRYLNSDGNIVMSHLKFDRIGDIYDKRSEEDDPSRGAIYIADSNHNTITKCRFTNITNAYLKDQTPGKSGYGGLHAIYLDRSHRTKISSNYFNHVYARGIIKTRNLSNFTVITGNRFMDNTSLYTDQPCDLSSNSCPSLANGAPHECPSHGTLFTRNRIKYDRFNANYLPSIDILNYQADTNYCKKENEGYGIISTGHNVIL